MLSVGSAVDLLVVVAVLAGVPLTWSATLAPPAGTGRGPGPWLAGVVAAVYLNQVLFSVYVLRVHDGDPGFIARYLPPGWFALADGAGMRAVAAAFGAPELLEFSVLRAQAFLELPFVVLAYLCVCRWLDPVRARALTAPAVLLPACVAWTVVFGLVEWGLRNPYTGDDLVLRGVSCVVTAVLAGRLRPHPTGGAPGSGIDVLIAVGSAASLGVLVLLVYDTALLYNLGHVPGLLPVAAVAGGVLLLARLAARRRAAGVRGPGPGIRAVASGLAWFAALFFVPALPIRYAMDLGTPWITVAGAVVVAGAAVVLTVRDVVPGERAAVVARMSVAVVAGVVAAGAALLPPPTYPEVRILLAAALFLVTVTGVCAATDALLPRAPERDRAAAG
ncbi:hypothetical protein [Dactylosporangium sp. NPDC005555]|uniref:hypothetical protein n=1 Tax=Dactylosporangium sp. NPDC005555 TaxID=3154889 RepID=UPI0033A2DB00